jgi:hypothetical protein
VESVFPSATTRDRVYEQLRERASFHLFSPLVEAYFFGEPEALARAGADKAPSLFDPSHSDVEAFVVDDPRFLAPGSVKAAWSKSDRARHPKRYVQYLCDPTGEGAAPYRETHEGAAALRTLAWDQVLAAQGFVRHARAVFSDIAEAAGLAQSPFPGEEAALTARRDDGLLRNI